MNEKIAKLIKESNLEECIDDAYLMRDDWQPFIEKFAELIVRECAAVAHCNFHVDGVTLGNIMKEHFGVEE
jgi:hypothetical protein